MSDLREILSDDQLSALREGYDDAEVSALSGAVIEAPYPPGAPFAALLTDEIFSTENMSARDRELCLIAMMAANPAQLTLGIHGYRGIMSGLSPGDVAQATLVVGAYAGVAAYRRCCIILDKTYNALAEVAGDGSNPVPWRDAIGALAALGE